ncbi:GEM-like protein 7 [Beta vulgaris subsp. vulgaris]|uniref:GEM-like protein 7 n=1 Tax=Beta vulgaris subsp. vulgaris TaxID=3555 RepID=UPI0020375A17|nr:GEM-like protein 7 [Beta vulgaris subsp. vulgaris]
MNVPERFTSKTMKTLLQDTMLRNQSSGRTMYEYDQNRKTPTIKSLPGPSIQGDESSRLAQSKLIVSKTSKQQGERSHKFANGIKEHVKGKLSLGAKLLRLGSMEKVCKQVFSVREGERLLKASQCCLSTTAGPIAGLLFISTEKLAFCSDRSIVKLSSPTGELRRFHYKVVIPLRKIERANQRENTKKASKKYLQLNTTDEFEFWFMGFLNYKKMFKCLQEAIDQALDY